MELCYKEFVDIQDPCGIKSNSEYLGDKCYWFDDCSNKRAPFEFCMEKLGWQIANCLCKGYLQDAVKKNTQDELEKYCDRAVVLINSTEEVIPLTRDTMGDIMIKGVTRANKYLEDAQKIKEEQFRKVSL